MIMAERLLREAERYLVDDNAEQQDASVVCQIGGHDAATAAQAVRLLASTRAESNHNYCYEVNLNAECPSNHVCTKHEMGAALMKRVDVAVQMLRAMREAARVRNDDDDRKHINCATIKPTPLLPAFCNTTRGTFDCSDDAVARRSICSAVPPS